MSKEKIAKAVASILKARKTGIACDPIRKFIGEQNIDDAYFIQETVARSFVKEGASPIGKKIGLTSFSVQKQLGINEPDFGLLFDDMEVLNGWEVGWSELMQPKIEAEIAFVLSSDLLNPNLKTIDLFRSIDYAIGCLEIVGSRIKNWDIKIADTIADNASSSHFILGHQIRKISDISLTDVEMKMYKNEELVSHGNGAACLGSPLNALLWLAKKQIQMGNPLRKNDLILTGALGPMTNLAPGDQVRAEIQGFGSIHVSVGLEK